MKNFSSLQSEERKEIEDFIKEARDSLKKESEKKLRSDSFLKILQKLKNSSNQYFKNLNRQGVKGKDIDQCRSDLTDFIVGEIFERAFKESSLALEEKQQFRLPIGKNKNSFKIERIATGGKNKNNGISIIALGGYGRRELSQHSDIDILFLQEEGIRKSSLEEIVSSILMVLWDLGFKVGHATRSFAEVMKHANQDMLSKTALLEMRYIKGDKKSFKKLKEQFYRKCLYGKEKKYISWRLEDLQKMHEKFGKTVFMQEPNIKSGKGGLRDYQNLLWIATVHTKASTLSQLVKLKYLRESERRKLERNESFLLNVREEMHFQEKRAQDRLTLRLQGVIAKALGYPQKDILKRSEAFMKDYYEKTREIHLITTLALERMNLLGKRRNIISAFLSKKFNREKEDGFLLRGGIIFPEHRHIFNKDPHRMMKAFYLAQIKSAEFSPELSELIKKRLLLVDHRFQESLKNRDLFFLILSRKGEVGRILRLMHDLGFLGKYLPEFGALTCLVQHEFYHQYTADEHTLVCIEKIDQLLFTNNQKLFRYGALFKNLDDPAILYLAMLLHDIGKAANTPHHAKASLKSAERIATRLGLNGERKERLLTLIEHHGELGVSARTRDLEDVTTTSHLAKIVQTLPTLEALMILTLADGMGTADAQWSDWKEQLVWSLFEKTKNYLDHGGQFFKKAEEERVALEEKVKLLLGKSFSEEIRVHFEQMPERYFRTVEPAVLIEHLKVFRNFFERFEEQQRYQISILDPEIYWKEHLEQGYTEVWICGWDRKYLLEKIAAAFLMAGINILGADIFTRADQVTLDIFRVNSVRRDSVITEKEKQIMEQSLKGFLKTIEKPFFKQPAPYSLSHWKPEVEGVLPRVVVDSHSHPIYTLVEVEAPDRQGLFYDLLGIFSQQGISIDLARIATEMRAAFDTFYVLNAAGKKIETAKEKEMLAQELVTAILTKTLSERVKLDNK